jgi:hypothetical protein
MVTDAPTALRRPAMEHLAIDLGARESQVCARAAEGTIVLEMRCATAALRTVLSRRPPSRVVVETCAAAFAVAALARELGHEWWCPRVSCGPWAWAPAG